MSPVSKPPPFWVAVWTIESELCQRTSWPTRTLALAGAKDMPPASPTISITTALGLGVGVGTGVWTGAGLGVGLSEGEGDGSGVRTGAGDDWGPPEGIVGAE
jgi:hypothetical protein